MNSFHISLLLLCALCIHFVDSFGIIPPTPLRNKLNQIPRGLVCFSMPRITKYVAPKMSDMSDMTIEMLKRLERTVDELSETDLIRVRLISLQFAHSFPDFSGFRSKVCVRL